MSTPAERDGAERLRRVVLEALMEHFAQEHMTIEQFDARIELARSTRDPTELKRLLRDLPGGAGADARARGPA